MYLTCSRHNNHRLAVFLLCGKCTCFPDLLVLHIVEASASPPSSGVWSTKGVGSSAVSWRGCVVVEDLHKRFCRPVHDFVRAALLKWLFRSVVAYKYLFGDGEIFEIEGLLCSMSSSTPEFQSSGMSRNSRTGGEVVHIPALLRIPGNLLSKLLECQAWRWRELWSSSYFGVTRSPLSADGVGVQPFRWLTDVRLSFLNV